MVDRVTHITCVEVVELVSDYLEGALSPEDAELFEQHLNFCEGCESYLHQMRVALGAADRVGEEAVPEEMRERLLAAFRDWRRS
jgi:predicted anti-sigma-YlaC factor YlaD